MKNKINLQMQNISFVLIIALAVWLKISYYKIQF